MALPSNGTQISFSDIYEELTGSAPTGQVSLNSAENGAYATINTNSINRPDGSTPNRVSEWFLYDQNATSGTPNMPTILSYSGSTRVVHDNSAGISYPYYDSARLTNENYLTVGVHSERGSAQTIYAAGVDWSGTTPSHNSMTSIQTGTNGYYATARYIGITLCRLTDTKAALFYTTSSSRIRVLVLSYSGGASSVVVESSTNFTGNGTLGMADSVYIGNDGNNHYVGISSADSIKSYNAYFKVFRINTSTNAVTFIDESQGGAGADQFTNVGNFGNISGDTYTLLMTFSRNTGLAGPLGYGVYNFDVSTETLTRITSLGVNITSASSLMQTRHDIMVNMGNNKLGFTYDRYSGTERARYVVMSTNGSSVTIETDNQADTSRVVESMCMYWVDGYQFPEYQVISVYRDIDINNEFRVNKLNFNDTTNVFTEDNSIEYKLNSSGASFWGGQMHNLYLKDKNNAILFVGNNDQDTFDYYYFSIND